ncbi:MipA/OmpV family protein [Teredinibacter turnerae]|uniref:MipA/OmpV family protein n=1 Tax=Teredinibacter turnerae TaxID=2426 RepID=UPI0003FE4AF0|nr:MipA/OmpV family protein [Teredinibacter turnerae]
MKKYVDAIGLLFAVSAASAFGMTEEEAKQVVARVQSGATYTEMRAVKHKGSPAYELEYIYDGDEYEVIVAPDGTVLDQYKDSGMPVIVSLALDVSTQLYREQDAGVELIPVIVGSYKKFWFRGLQHGFYAYKNPYLSISPMIKLNPDIGYSVDNAESGSTLYEGLDDTSFSAEGGLQLMFELPGVSLEVNMLTDLLGDHEGQLVEVALSHAMHFGPALLVPEIKYSYNTEEIGQFYFGVDPQDATLERPAFEVGSTSDIELSTVLLWRFASRWYMVSEASYKMYDNKIEDSPLVDDTTQASIFVGVGISF